MSNVRRTLAALGLGLAAQRALQLLALLALARQLGTAATGLFAQGVAFGSLLAVLANAGLRNPVARGVAAAPDAAGSWLRLAVAARLRRSSWLCLLCGMGAFALSDQPLFWCLGALQALPLAFDLKHLGDAAARTRREVGIETAAAAAFLAAVLIWLHLGRTELVELLAIQLGSRGLYASAAAAAIRSLPKGPVPAVGDLLRSARSLAPSQIAGEVCAAGDAWFVARLAGTEVAGLYAVAARIAGALAMPSAQLARLFFAHQLHAAAGGDADRTTRVALRSTALVLLPLAGSGAVAADELCGLFGNGFGAAGPALRWLLLAVTAQHLGWQGHQALLAAGRDRAFAAAHWVPALVHPMALVALTPALGAVGAGAAAAMAQTGFAAAALAAVGPCALRPPSWLIAPLALGAATAAATAVGRHLGLEPPLLGQIALGALVFAFGLWRSELRRGWSRIGSGLAAASGFRS